MKIEKTHNLFSVIISEIGKFDTKLCKVLNR